MLIKALYIGLVISVIVVLAVAGAMYAHVRKHMDGPEKHAPEIEKPPVE